MHPYFSKQKSNKSLQLPSKKKSHVFPRHFSFPSLNTFQFEYEFLRGLKIIIANGVLSMVVQRFHTMLCFVSVAIFLHKSHCLPSFLEFISQLLLAFLLFLHNTKTPRRKWRIFRYF